MANQPPHSPFGVEAQQPFAPTPPNRGPMILGIVAATSLVAVLFCCGGFVLLMKFGLDVISIEVQDQLAATPEVQENIGEIESFEVDFLRSSVHEDEDVFVYDIVGTRGKGRVVVKQTTGSDGGEEIISAELTMSDGRKITIDVPSEYDSPLD